MNAGQWYQGIAVLFIGLLISSVFDLSAHAAVIGSVNKEGKIVLKGDGEELDGYALDSDGDYLIPIPPGDVTADADPFMVLLKNDTDQVVFASVRSPVTLDGILETEVGYSAPPGTDFKIDLAESVWGNASLSPEPIPIEWVPISEIPEPASGLLALVGALSLVGLRRHRNPHVG